MAHLLELSETAKTTKPTISRPHTQYQRQATASPSKVSTFILKLVKVDLNSLPRHLNRTSVSVLRAFFHTASAAFFAHLNLFYYRYPALLHTKNFLHGCYYLLGCLVYEAISDPAPTSWCQYRQQRVCILCRRTSTLLIVQTDRCFYVFFSSTTKQG